MSASSYVDFTPRQDALDAVQTGVMLLDSALRVTFANDAACEELDRYRYAIDAAFGVDSDQIVGTPLTHLHDSPERLNVATRHPNTLPHTSRVVFEGLTAEITISSLNPGSHAPVGYLATWNVLSV